MISSKSYPKSVLDNNERLKSLSRIRKEYILSKITQFIDANGLKIDDIVLCGGASLIWADRIYVPIVRDIDILLPIGFDHSKFVKVDKCDAVTGYRFSYLRPMINRAEKINGIWCLSKHDILFTCAHAFVNKEKDKSYEEPRVNAMLADYTEQDIKECYDILDNEELLTTDQDNAFDVYIRRKLKEREDELCQINQ